MSDSKELSAEERRALRKEALAAERKVQREKDFAALDGFEIEHGDSNVAYHDVETAPGLPTMIVVRCPNEHETKRFRQRTTPKKDGTIPTPFEAAEELAKCCCLYPDADTLAKVSALRPGALAGAGTKAIQLALGVAEAKGKD